MGKGCIQGGHLIALTLSESTARKIEEDHATGRLVASEPSSCMTLRNHAFPPARHTAFLIYARSSHQSAHDFQCFCNSCIAHHDQPLQTQHLTCRLST